VRGGGRLGRLVFTGIFRRWPSGLRDLDLECGQPGGSARGKREEAVEDGEAHFIGTNKAGLDGRNHRNLLGEISASSGVLALSPAGGWG
jgi:hypothetical protein